MNEERKARRCEPSILHYTIVIQWSDRDQLYIASFPEWEAAGMIGHTHGKTYEEALYNAQDVLEMLVESAQEDGDPLPHPRTFSPASPAIV